MTPEEAQEQLQIGKSQYYEYCKQLGIKSRKISGTTQITDEQFQQLRNYLEEKRGGTTLVTSTTGSIEEEEGELELPDEINLEDNDAVNQLYRQAAELKAQQILQPQMVLLHLAEQLSEEDLPDDLKQKIAEAREGVSRPLAHPAEVASQILRRVQNKNQ